MEMANLNSGSSRSLPGPAFTSQYRPSVSQTPAQIAAELRSSISTYQSNPFSDNSNAPTYTSTTRMLKNFNSRGSTAIDQRQRAQSIARRQSASARAGRLLRQLEGQKQFEELDNWQRVKRIAANIVTQPEYPDEEDLITLAHEVFPPRMAIKVQVCDIGSDRGNKFETTLGNIEACWKQKPAWAKVRWIHAPLGQGLVHSSIEDMFLHDWHKGRSFDHAGTVTFPYLELDTLQFYPRSTMQDMRDIYFSLKSYPPVHNALNKGIFRDNRNETFEKDLLWRANHLGAKLHFWDLVQSDMPMELSEGVSLEEHGPLVSVLGMKRKLDDSAVQQGNLQQSHLMRARFRSFHRADGCVLTMSAGKGIDYLNRDFQDHLKDDPDAVLTNPDVSVVGHLLEKFEVDGMKGWEQESVEYFLVYLFTELGVTPHNIREGRNSISTLTAMQATVQELKRCRFQAWQPKKTVKLVQQYLVCAEELKTLDLLLRRKADFFQRLRLDIIAQHEEDTRRPSYVDSEHCEPALERLDFAIKSLERDIKDTEYLSTDLSQAMNSLFQLRSIEQNELAITADSQNKAILIFTGVTVVFLPLSFFTSYFGMNLQGIMDTTRNETYFWKICGSVTVVILLIIVAGVFGRRIFPNSIPRSEDEDKSSLI